MNNSEVLEKLRAYLKCQENKVKGINALCNHNLCDDCDLCYMQGTTGEHIEAIEVAIQALKKFKAYEDLEEQGRLIILPCKVGDTVYHAVQGRIIEVSNVDLFFLLLSVAENRFNNSVFLTKSEAEAKLKELRCNND